MFKSQYCWVNILKQTRLVFFCEMIAYSGGNKDFADGQMFRVHDSCTENIKGIVAFTDCEDFTFSFRKRWNEFNLANNQTDHQTAKREMQVDIAF